MIGVNNTSISRYLNPSLSTINIKRDEIASWILKLLIQLNDKTDKKENLKVLLTTELIERNTI
ncbi:MAG: substrate-binding domain-containing protein [Spirochaetales bacterium]|nr:substrate-binding domain-containing protein [Spirochaetales bacterium]